VAGTSGSVPPSNIIEPEHRDLAKKIVLSLSTLNQYNFAQQKLREGNAERARQILGFPEGAEITAPKISRVIAFTTFQTQAAAIRLEQKRNPELIVPYARFQSVFEQAVVFVATEDSSFNKGDAEAAIPNASQPLFHHSNLCNNNMPGGSIIDLIDGNFLAAKEILSGLNHEIAQLEQQKLDQLDNADDLNAEIADAKELISDIKLAIGPLKGMAAAVLQECRSNVDNEKANQEANQEANLRDAEQKLSAAEHTNNRLHIEDIANDMLECRKWGAAFLAICHEAVPQGVISGLHFGAIRNATEDALIDSLGDINLPPLVHALARGAVTGLPLGFAHYALTEAAKPFLGALMQYIGARKPEPVEGEKLYPDPPRVEYEDGELRQVPEAIFKDRTETIKQQRLGYRRLQQQAKLGTVTGDWTAFGFFAAAHGLRAGPNLMSIASRSVTSGLGGAGMALGHTVNAMWQSAAEIPEHLQALRPDIKDLPTHRLGKQLRFSPEKIWDTNKQALKDGARKAITVNPADGRFFDPVLARTLLTRYVAAASGITVTGLMDDMLQPDGRVPDWVNRSGMAALKVFGLLGIFYPGITADSETAGAAANANRTGIGKSDAFKGTRTAVSALFDPSQDHVANLAGTETSKLRRYSSNVHNLHRHFAIVPQQLVVETIVAAPKLANWASGLRRRRPQNTGNNNQV
jgi:hypothetical protein